MKFRWIKTAKLLLILYIINTIEALESLFSLNLSASNSANSMKSNTSNKAKNKGLIDDSTIHYHGWCKYFKYQPSSLSQGKKQFFENKEFQSILKYSTDIEKLTNKHFYCVLRGNQLTMYNSKDSNTSVNDALSLNVIINVFEDDKFNAKGGVKGYKKYDEGYCFQVITSLPKSSFFNISYNETYPKNGIQEIWVICNEKQFDALNLMTKLAELRIKLQESVGRYIYNTNSSEDKKIVNNLSSIIKNTKSQNQTPQIQNNNYGKWILIKDWGECSLKCGGGTQTQQLICIPSQNGKKCLGPSIRQRPCNIQPCEKSKDIQTEIKEQTTIKTLENAKNLGDSRGLDIKPVETKVLSLSEKPLKYEKCYLKESNAVLINSDTKERLPVRLIMTDKSIIAYSLTDLDKQLTVYILDKTILRRKKSPEKCFDLQSADQSKEFCELTANSVIDFDLEWEYDFNLFKTKCKGTKETQEKNKKLINQVQSEFEKKKETLLKEKEKKLIEQMENKQTQDEEQNLLGVNFKSINDESVNAFEKQARLASLLELEEEVKEREENAALREKVEQERKKENVLMQVFQAKIKEGNKEIESKRLSEKIQQIKEVTNKDLQRKREELKRRILLMRKKNSRKQIEMEEEINKIKGEVSKKIDQLSKKDNVDICFINIEEKDADTKILAYCEALNVDELIESMKVSSNGNGLIEKIILSKKEDCKKKDNFCFSCCENEIGELLVKDREECYDKCEKKRIN